MKRFFKQVSVVVVSIFISIVLLFMFLHLFARPRQPKLRHNTVLHIALHGRVVEHTADPFVQLLKRRQEEVIDLLTLKKAIKHACEDKKIQGIYLEAGALRAGWANLEEIRAALLAFKKAGKFIVAYGENYTQKAYYLASVADDIVLPPAGIFLLQGLQKTVFFYKNLLDKLEITPQIFRVGKYKSAIEPFIHHRMSQASKQQSRVLLHTIYGHFLHQVATARNLKRASLQKIINELAVVLPQEARQAKLVSHIGHYDQVEALINNRLAAKGDDTIHYIAYQVYASLKKPAHNSSNKVAVLIAEGPIVDGEGELDTIGSHSLAADLRAAREDDTIKAIVLRINSPGGSALASDVLWQELMLTKAQKPVVASLSDVAASGGYYMAAACNQVVAHPTTITGSIGIFGLFFDVNVLLNKTLGITTDVVKTSRSADLFRNPGRPIRNIEKAVVQRVIDQGYHTFLERVALGRDLKKEAVARVASGRVWSGYAAKKRGLVDKLGGLEEAIQVAAKLATIEKDYTVTYWSKHLTLYEQLLQYWRGEVSNEPVLSALQKHFPALQSIQELIRMRGIQARLPYAIEID